MLARAEKTPELVPSLVPAVGFEGVVGLETGPVATPPSVAKGRTERVAPAAGFVMKISGAIHAAAPAATPVETPPRSGATRHAWR